jgi:hypothetical protein
LPSNHVKPEFSAVYIFTHGTVKCKDKPEVAGRTLAGKVNCSVAVPSYIRGL